MIIGLGIDLVEHNRIERELARGAWLLEDGIFTRDEIQHCSGTNPVLRFASCFAAKEAMLKAMNAPIGDLAMFREVEIRVGADSGYHVLLHGRARAQSENLGTRQIRLSIAHSKKSTAAMAILDG